MLLWQDACKGKYEQQQYVAERLQKASRCVGQAQGRVLCKRTYAPAERGPRKLSLIALAGGL